MKSAAEDDMNESPKAEKPGAYAALRIRNFRFLLTGTVFVNAATWTQVVAMSWLVYHLTESGTILGSINLLRSLASISIIPLAGLLIDKYDRKKTLLLLNFWRFLLNFALGIILLSGHYELTILFAFTLLFGLAQTVDQTMQQVAIFDLVPRQLTPNSVSIVQTGWALMRSFGPGIGGFLILWFGVGVNFLILAGIYALIIVIVINISYPQRTTPAAKKSPLHGIKEGLLYIIQTRTLRAFMFTGFILPFFIIPTFLIMPAIYAKDIFHGGADTQGLLTAAVGVGGVVGGFVTTSLVNFDYRGRLLLAALFLLSCSLIGFALSPTLLPALVCLTLAGFFEMIFIATNQTLIQLTIPDHMRGRLTAMVNLNSLLAPMGCLFAGIGCDLIGSPRLVTIIMSSGAAAIVVLIMIFSRNLRNYRISDAMKEDGKSRI